MKQVCYIRNNNLHESEQNDLSSCRKRNMQVSTPIKLFFIKKIKVLMVLGLILFLSGSAFAVDIKVTGATSPYTAVNGTYVQQSDQVNGYVYWKHQTAEYYIFNDGGYWTIDANTDNDGVAIFGSDDYGASSPATVVLWKYSDGSGAAPISVSEVSVNPEINLKGNNTTITRSDLTPSFSDHTKLGSVLPNSGTATRTFTIQNTGGAALTVSSITSNNSEFTIASGWSSSLVANTGSTTFTVTFAPTGTGDRNAIISIVNTDSDENPYTFGLNGYGYTTTALVVSGITTPSAANGNYISQGVKNNFQYWKHATENYYIFNFIMSGVAPTWVIDTDQDGTNGFLFSYNSEAVSPSGLTPWTGTPGNGSPVVSGVTAAPEINLVGNHSRNIASGDNSPSRYDGTNFGSLDYSSGSRTRTFTIQNTGTAALTLSGSTPYVSLSGATSDFSVTTAPSNSIAASGSTTFLVTFNPTSEGTKTAVVTITNNDSDEGTYTFTIQGDGFTPKNIVLSGVIGSSANGTYTHQGLINEYQYWKYGSYYIYNSDNGGTEDANWYIDNDTDRSSYYFKSSNNGENGFPMNVTSWTSSGGSGTPVIQYAATEINITGNSETILYGDATPSIYDYTDFGYTGIAAGTVVHTFTIQNAGTETLTLSGNPSYVAVGGADAAYFVVSGPASGSIAAGASTTFTVTFDPDALREFNATLSIANNDGNENPYNFSIKGTGSASPTVTTQAVSGIGTTSATGNGNLTYLGYPNPTAYGICYGETANPDITGSKVDKGAASATGAFTTQITGLTAGTTYHTRAFVTNVIETIYGTDVTFTTITVPEAPTIGTATAGDTQATISFTAPSFTGGSTISGYTVTSSPGGITATGTASPITVIGLTNGTAYTFTVVATNSAGTSAPSSASNSVTPNASQSITFTNPGTQIFGTTPTLTATASSSLAVTFSTSTPDVCTITSGGTLTFLKAGTCTILANQAGNATYTAAPTVSQTFTVNAVVPEAPTIGTATAGDTQATISFTAPSFTGGSTISGYTATSSPGGITKTGTVSPITVTGLTNGTTYTFTVTATNIAGTSGASVASNGVTPHSRPTATTDAATDITSSGVTLNGTINANGASTAVTFEYGTTIAYGTSVTALQSPISGILPTSVSKTLTGLISNTTYHYRVVGVNEAATTVGLDQTFTTALDTGLDNPTAAVLSLYPNPATEGFYINIGEKKTLISISDLNGSLVFRQKITGETYIDVSALQPGIYIVEVNGLTEKLVKNSH